LMQLVYTASRYELGTPVTVCAHSLLKALGRGASGKEHNQLKAEIDRLVNGTIYLKTKRFDYIGHLIDDAQQDKKTKFWTYRANPTLGKFYDVGNYTLIDWEERKALKGKDLARWLQLQLQLSTHARPPMRQLKPYLSEITQFVGTTIFDQRIDPRRHLLELTATGTLLKNLHGFRPATQVPLTDAADRRVQFLL